MKAIPRVQGGFAAIAAIFLVVILAALGAFMVTFSNAQHLNSAKDLQGSRAYWAARAGLEWGISSVNAASACPAASTALTIEGFAVQITCDSRTYADGTNSIAVYQLTSVASMGSVGSVGYIERSLSAAMEM